MKLIDPSIEIITPLNGEGLDSYEVEEIAFQISDLFWSM